MSTKKPIAAATPEPTGDCPHCGRCPNCGRRDAAPVFVPYPVYPWYPQPVFRPTYYWPVQWTITSGADPNHTAAVGYNVTLTHNTAAAAPCAPFMGGSFTVNA